MMGYALNELANLPVDDNIHFYIFVVNGQYREPLYDMIQQNFIAIAKSIGSNAVIAVGTDPKGFSSEVKRKYFGESKVSFAQALPALLITNAHPDKLTKDSVRLIRAVARCRKQVRWMAAVLRTSILFCQR